MTGSTHPLLNSCQNCGCPYDTFYYQHVKKGITLCDWCADKRVASVSKKRHIPEWQMVDGKYILSELVEKYRSNE